MVEDVLFMRDDILNNRRNDVERFLSACFKAIDYWKAHPDEGNNIIARNLNLPLADVQSMLEGIKIMDYNDNRTFFVTSASPGQAYQAYKNAVDAWTQEGLIEKPSNPQDGIDSSFISNLKR